MSPANRDEITVLSVAGILGYGFPVESFKNAVDGGVDCIACDAGSTDPGPAYLGMGKSFTTRAAVKRDLKLMIEAGVERRVPVLVGSAGGSGARPHVEWNLDIVDEIARELGRRLRVAVIWADIDKATVKKALAQGRVRPLGPVPQLTEEAIDATTHIVAQMGVEPFVKALEGEPDVVIAGRSYDPSMFAVMGIMRGYEKGVAMHMGKILECGAIAAVPGSGSDCLVGRLGPDYFIVEPPNPKRRCTTVSVAGHTLYEKSDPYRLPGPGGMIDLTESRFEQISERAVKVTGSKYVPSPVKTLKLEGARKVGYRTVSIAGTRDPIMIRQIDSIIEAVKEETRTKLTSVAPEDYTIIVHVYGKNGVMGSLEPVKETASHELGIVIEAIARTQDEADAVCGFARSTMLHYGYEGRKATAGNLAFLYSPSDLRGGEVYEFSMNHLLEVDDLGAPFPIEFREMG